MKRCGKCPACQALEVHKTVLMSTLGRYKEAIYIPGNFSESDRKRWNEQVTNNPCENLVEDDE